ncbi:MULTISPECIES: YHS domain-containing protein [Emticicia]|uniref:YHS domain-containing protein n=1 Tax=Emticicia TaxID=312278 RepID=UPI0020A18BC5|nr:MULTISPECIES: YHS domain-containing protein [Emticicia]UTA66352.1 YHS domain-containing protein [Emticicia sp. 21SJ11W-3]
MKTLIVVTMLLAGQAAALQQTPTAQQAQPEQAQKDPVCGMKVKKDAKFRSVHKEKEHLFCSKSCKEKFDSNPEKYVKK